MSDKLPQAIHEGSLTFAGVAIRTYVLDDGRRIVNADDFANAFDAMQNGAKATDDEMRAYTDYMAGRDFPS